MILNEQISTYNSCILSVNSANIFSRSYILASYNILSTNFVMIKREKIISNILQNNCYIKRLFTLGIYVFWVNIKFRWDVYFNIPEIICIDYDVFF